MAILEFPYLVEEVNRKALIQALVDDLNLQNGIVEIKVQNNKWIYVKVTIGFNQNECNMLENIDFKC